MEVRVYLDTSVFSALLDERAPERQALTQEFWARLPGLDGVTSELARTELGQTAETGKAQRLVDLLGAVTVVPVDAAMVELAGRYIQSGAFTAAMYNDAVHAAAAVRSRCEVLLSWNFRHLVNRRRRAMVNQINRMLSLPSVEIVAPPEL